MSEGNIYLRATVDLCVFVSEKPHLATFAKKLIDEAKWDLVDERLGRELFDQIRDGGIEIDSVSSVEDHT